MIRLRGVWGWALLALVLFPATILLSVLISSLLGRQPITAHQFQETGLALIGLVAVKFLYQFFFFNATGEETGWRGFALPRLQARISPLIASLIMALFWAPWHLLSMAGGRRAGLFLAILDRQACSSTFPHQWSLVWFYNRSKGSILVAGVYHAAANTAFAFFPNWTIRFSLDLGIFVLAIILVDRMWKKLPPTTRRCTTSRRWMAEDQ